MNTQYDLQPCPNDSCRGRVSERDDGLSHCTDPVFPDVFTHDQHSDIYGWGDDA